MSEVRARKRQPTAEEVRLTERMKSVAPSIYALGASIRGVGIGLPLRNGDSPVIFVNVSFPNERVLASIHDLLREDPHKVFDITRRDNIIER